MQKIFIRNDQERLQTVCVIEHPKEGSKLQPTRHNIQLEPGANPVEKKLWDLALSNKVVKALVSEGKLIEMGPTADGSIAGLKEEEALAVVKETFSLKLLRTWAIDDKRAKVQAAIRKRLEESEAATKVEEQKS